MMRAIGQAAPGVSVLGLAIGLSLGVAVTHTAELNRLLDDVMLQSAIAAEIESGIDYGALSMTACGDGLSVAACRCAMEQIEKEIGFAQFADAVIQGAGAIRDDARYGAAVARAWDFCRISSPAPLAQTVAAASR
jgi:hypothetical protein